MHSHALHVALYRFRATFARRWAGYLTLVLLIALLGGLAMGSVAAARRTQSSFPQYLAATDPLQLSGVTAEFIPGLYNTGYNPTTIAKIDHLAHVTDVQSVVGLDVAPIQPNGGMTNPSLATSMTFVGTLAGSLAAHGAGINLVAGRIPDPRNAHAFVADKVAAQRLHLHLGATVHFGVYTNAQTQLRGFGTATVQPFRRLTARLVGIITTPQQLVEDDVDASTGNVAFTPAFSGTFLKCCSDFTQTDIGVQGSSAVIAQVAQAARNLVPRGSPPFNDASVTVAKAERAIKPESIALGAFGGIVALVALLIAGQFIGRQLRIGTESTAILRALGADPTMTAADGLVGILSAVVCGAILAMVVAVLLSPLAPLGPVRPFYPTPGIAFDWLVLLVGAGILAVFLSVVAVLLAYRYSPRRIAQRFERAPANSFPFLSAVSKRLPAPALVGARFAVESGRGVDSVPVRSVIFGTALALIVVMSTIIFGASLNSLVSNPSLYGWNWNYELDSEFGSGNIPQTQVASLLAQDRDVAAWSGAYFETPMINGEVVPIIGQSPGAVVAPPILTGHGLEHANEIVLGAVTLASLHKHIGDVVTVQSAVPGTDQVQTAHLRIVGTATMPTIGQGTSTHLEMGTGAVMPFTVIPARLRDPPTSETSGGPDAIFLRLKPGVTAAAALPQLRRIAAATANNNNDGVVVNAVEHPAEIVNYKTLGATPAILGGALAAGAIIALALTLVAAVRRRRRDLALLKTLGFTRRQLTAAVACQASVTVALGLLVGIPLGIVSGRYLWDLFADDIHVVPAPTVAVLTVALVALGTIVVANVVSLLPGRIAARTSTGTLLRAD